MGATKNIKELIFSQDLTERTCSQCDKFFTMKDYKNDNWNLEYRTNTNMDFTDFREGTSKGKVNLVIELAHNDCPEVKDNHPPRKDHTTATEYEEAESK